MATEPTRNKRKGDKSIAGEASGLDDIDQKIVALLRENGRVANRDLARQVEVSEATIRARLRRLEKRNMLRVVAMRDLSALGFDIVAPIALLLKGRTAIEVGKELAEIENVITVNVAIGSSDIEMQVVAQSLDELEDLLTNTVANIPGIAQIIPCIALKVFKYDSEWAPL